MGMFTVRAESSRAIEKEIILDDGSTSGFIGRTLYLASAEAPALGTPFPESTLYVLSKNIKGSHTKVRWAELGQAHTTYTWRLDRFASVCVPVGYDDEVHKNVLLSPEIDAETLPDFFRITIARAVYNVANNVEDTAADDKVQELYERNSAAWADMEQRVQKLIEETRRK